MTKTLAFCVEFSKYSHLAINESVCNVRKLFIQQLQIRVEVTDWTQCCMVQNLVYSLPLASKTHMFESHTVWSCVCMCAACIIGRNLQDASPLPSQFFIHLQTTFGNLQKARGSKLHWLVVPRM
jgi:hypothetical protein